MTNTEILNRNGRFSRAKANTARRTARMDRMFAARLDEINANERAGRIDADRAIVLRAQARADRRGR